MTLGRIVGIASSAPGISGFCSGGSVGSGGVGSGFSDGSGALGFVTFGVFVLVGGFLATGGICGDEL